MPVASIFTQICLSAHVPVSETHWGLVSFHLKATVNLFCKEGATQSNIKHMRQATTLAFEEAQTR